VFKVAKSKKHLTIAEELFNSLASRCFRGFSKKNT